MSPEQFHTKVRAMVAERCRELGTELKSPEVEAVIAQMSDFLYVIIMMTKPSDAVERLASALGTN